MKPISDVFNILEELKFSPFYGDILNLYIQPY